jgi:hypothetical protein
MNNNDTNNNAGGRIALVMEAVSTPQTSVGFYQTRRRIIPEDSHLYLNIGDVLCEEI